MSAKFGTLEWSKKNNGVLTPIERLLFLRNMAFLAAREALDALRDRFGLLKPIDLDFSDVAPPNTQMARDAEVFARETHTQDLLAHGYRTYYFGAILGAYSKLTYDRELYFTAALLHDIGLTDSRAVPLKACCFAVTGGRQIHDFLICKGHPREKAQIVGEAICAHLNLHLPVRDYGEVAALVAKGAVCDLFGFGKRRLHGDFHKNLLLTYPAGNIQAALLSDEKMAPGSRLDFGRGLSGGLPERIWIQNIK